MFKCFFGVFRGDHTCCDFYLTVLPANTDAAVFSIDGSFTASVSIMGKDPKVQPGAVDVVRSVIYYRRAVVGKKQGWPI